MTGDRLDESDLAALGMPACTCPQRRKSPWWHDHRDGCPWLRWFHEDAS